MTWCLRWDVLRQGGHALLLPISVSKETGQIMKSCFCQSASLLQLCMHKTSTGEGSPESMPWRWNSMIHCLGPSRGCSYETHTLLLKRLCEGGMKASSEHLGSSWSPITPFTNNLPCNCRCTNQDLCLTLLQRSGEHLWDPVSIAWSNRGSLKSSSPSRGHHGWSRVFSEASPRTLIWEQDPLGTSCPLPTLWA